MSRCLRHKFLTILAVLWVLAFSSFTAHGMVICTGQDGHLELEPAHDSPAKEAHSCCAESVGECGDCSDTPLFAYYGILPTGTWKSRLPGCEISKMSPPTQLETVAAGVNLRHNHKIVSPLISITSVLLENIILTC
jgi:hypothetical protein